MHETKSRQCVHGISDAFCTRINKLQAHKLLYFELSPPFEVVLAWLAGCCAPEVSHPSHGRGMAGWLSRKNHSPGMLVAWLACGCGPGLWLELLRPWRSRGMAGWWLQKRESKRQAENEEANYRSGKMQIEGKQREDVNTSKSEDPKTGMQKLWYGATHSSQRY